jgi:hypothetical protein
MVRLRDVKSGSNILTVLSIVLVFALACLIAIGCGGGKEKTLDTPRGVVNTFISRVMEENDLMGAFALLSDADQKVIMKSPEVYGFIMGEKDPELEAYSDAYSQLAPDVLEMINELVKFNARKGEEQNGHVEVGLEISYPSDYMTIGFTLMGIANNLQQKYQNVKVDTLPKEERDKIIWSIKNDLKKAVANINTDKYSTYIFPVNVVDENGEWKINLGLAQQQDQFDFGY